MRKEAPQWKQAITAMKKREREPVRNAFTNRLAGRLFTEVCGGPAFFLLAFLAAFTILCDYSTRVLRMYDTAIMKTGKRDFMELREQLCTRFCSFYKPSRDAELSCGGYLAIQRLQAAKRLDLASCRKTYSSDTGERIAAILCIACPFCQDDCDFAQRVTGASPCGGFIVAASLMEQGVISIDDLLSVL